MHIFVLNEKKTSNPLLGRMEWSFFRFEQKLFITRNFLFGTYRIIRLTDPPLYSGPKPHKRIHPNNEATTNNAYS